MSGDNLSAAQHLAEFVERASPIATKAAIGTAGATAIVPKIWTLPEIATVIGIVSTVVLTISAVIFRYLAHRMAARVARLDEQLKLAQIKALKVE